MLKAINTAFLEKFYSSLARLEYRGKVSLVQKARLANDVLAGKIAEHGLNVAPVGVPCTLGDVYKSNTYTIQLGGSMDYKRSVMNAIGRAGNKGIVDSYEPDQRNTGYFPIFKDFLYCKNDLSDYAIAVYRRSDTSDPKYFLANGKEIDKYAFAQWAPSDDFKRWSGEEVKKSAVGVMVPVFSEDGKMIFLTDKEGNPILDKDGKPVPKKQKVMLPARDDNGNIIFEKDANGKLKKDEHGNPIPKEIPLPPFQRINLTNCRVYIKEQNITDQILLNRSVDMAWLLQKKAEFEEKVGK